MHMFIRVENIQNDLICYKECRRDGVEWDSVTLHRDKYSAASGPPTVLATGSHSYFVLRSRSVRWKKGTGREGGLRGYNLLVGSGWRAS